jgi:phage tail sheath protein FI
MALKFSESPAVTVREIDLTGVVPSVTSTTGAFVGDFNWGPVNTPVLVGTESELASTFGTPLAGDAYTGDFLSVAHFLKYSSSAFVVRAAKSGSISASSTPFTAKYPGVLGDSIVVDVCDESTWSVTDSDGTVDWTYQSLFSSKPEGDELHVVVLVDGSVVDTFEYTSTSPTAKRDDGSTNYVVDIINAGSLWVTLSGIPAAGTFTFSGGNDGTSADYVSAYGVFGDKDTIQIDFLVPPAGGQGDSIAIQQELVSIAEARKDCIAVVSPSFTGTLTVDQMLTHVSTLNQNSSYLVVDGNWLKVYDKFNDKYENIPAASSTAGIMAAGDVTDAPWFSPAGSRRGQYLGVTDILVNPSKTDRDRLYKAGINPIVSFPGQGVMLYGDKTHLSRPSAFDRINVRRLFLVLERAISAAAENVMFELNDDFTRAEFTNIVEPFLREVQGRRGITDFRVVCDETNNTPEVIDRNEFIASCFIKPARSINYVTLNFVAVRTGVEFEEVVGQV